MPYCGHMAALWAVSHRTAFSYLEGQKKKKKEKRELEAKQTPTSAKHLGSSTVKMLGERIS